MSDDSDDDFSMPPPADMPEGIVELFKSFMLMEDYKEALEFVNDSFGFIPTPFVVNEIIYKIIMNCDEKLAYEAEDYLQRALRIMPDHNDQKYNIINALNNQSGSNPDVWNVFSHFVWSSLYHLKIPEAYRDHSEYVKNPNCDILVEIYVKAFLKCPIKSVILGSHEEKRLSDLLKWINLFYKYNIQTEPVLEYLHKLLDYAVDSEISNDSSLPLCVKMHTAHLAPYMFLILNICKDVFATPERQQRFFNNSASPYLIIKVSQYRLHELIEKKTLPGNPELLTLKLMVDNYFFHHAKRTHESTKEASSKKSNSPRKSIRAKKLKKFSRDPVPGDTDFHVCCRLGRPADLLVALYENKTKNINTRNSIGNTPLHEACLTGSYLCSKFLIEEAAERKVDYWATDNEGRTALHCAICVDAFDIVNLLLNRGGTALIKCEDNWGRRPVDYCTSDEMRKLLQEVESKLEKLKEDESEGSSSLSSTQPKLPNLKNSEDYPLYLRILKTLVSNYCEIYDLPKDESDAAFPSLSHDNKECYHYKAESDTLCMEDSSTLDAFLEVLNKFISCVELVAKGENVKKELFHWNTFAAAFK